MESTLRSVRLSIALVFFVSATNSSLGFSGTVINGFVIDDPLVPESLIFHGGPPRDGIPPIDRPLFTDSKDLDHSMHVVGVYYNGVAKAYPIAILNYHEIVNDVFLDEPISVTYCPLCGTALAFKGRYGNEQTTFGVSGLLFDSDLLMYDRKTESLWSQIEGRAINGPAKGLSLEALPVMHLSLGEWLSRYPKSMVLSQETGHRRDYSRTPYGNYEHSQKIYFPVRYEDKRFHPKERVLGMKVGEKTKAYPFSELSKLNMQLKDEINGESIVVQFDQKTGTAFATDKKGKVLQSLTSFWFAWYTFHPETEVFQFSAE